MNATNPDAIPPILWDSALRRCRLARALLLWALLCGWPSALVQAQVASPAFIPPSGTRLPVTVTISNATHGASIYYTLDGTVPDTNATLYTGPLSFTNDTMLRARAFKTGLTPSDTVFAHYLSWDDPPGVSYRRAATNDLPELPLVTVMISGASNVACFTIEERLPPLVWATNVSGDGIWISERGAVRWGPFTNLPAAAVSYRVTGLGGTHLVDGSASVDGAWTFGQSPSPVTVLPPDVPRMPPPVAPPVFTPASGSNVPVDMTISCATTGAVIRYTVDGSLPSPASTLYTGAVHLVAAGVVRAQGFKDGWTPSVASVAYYGPPLTPANARVTRSVSTNPPFAPVVSFSATPGTNAACVAVEEWLPLCLNASNLTADGVFSVTNRVARWGPFFGTNPVGLSYQAVGQPGSYPVRATWSVDGMGGGEAVGTNVVVAGGSGVPTPPSQVPAPVLSPILGTNLPITVTISCTDPQAEVRFTTDGSLPTAGAPLYTSELTFATPTTLRARAFRVGYLPSVAVVGNYVAPGSGITLSLVRSVSGNGTHLPAVSVTATPQGNLQCYAVTETVAPGLTPYEIGPDAVWNETNRTLKWGPYADAAQRVLTYMVSGPTATYALAGQGSFDGTPVAVTGATSVMVDLTTMPVVATPVIAPTPNGVFPVEVTISCATTGAVIHFTTDGSQPDESSPVYSGPIYLATITVVQARAFRAWSVPSSVAQVFYSDEFPAEGTTVGRTITGSGSASPLVEIAVRPGPVVKCYAVREVIPAGLTPQEISGNGVFSTRTRTIRWGPFLDAQARTLTYRLSGADGTYELSGAGSFDGFGRETPGDRIVVVDNHPYLAHAAVSNWTYSVSVVVTSRPPVGASCYTVEEFLPAGVTPMNITDGGLWNSNTLTIKWGPFLDDSLRALRYDPVGAFGNYQTSARISVDGVSHTWAGDFTAVAGLPVPQDVSALAGNRIAYVFWTGSGHEAGFKLYYWTTPNRSDEQVVSIGPGTPGFHALPDLKNGTNYFLALTAFDPNGVESARSATVSARPTAAAGYYGRISLDATNYPSVTSAAVVTLDDADLNQDAEAAESVSIWVRSDTDTNGFPLLLKETGPDTAIFTSEANGTNLSFTFGPSDAVLKQLEVKEGDFIQATYDDALPAGQRVAIAQFMEYDSNGNGVPDWWERVYFGGGGIITPTSDSDGDGMSDIEEYSAGTDPTDPISVLKAVAPSVAGSEVVVRWRSVAGKRYTIEKANDLAEGFIELVRDIPGTPPVNSYLDANPSHIGQVFYRIRAQ